MKQLLFENSVKLAYLYLVNGVNSIFLKKKKNLLQFFFNSAGVFFLKFKFVRWYFRRGHCGWEEIAFWRIFKYHIAGSCKKVYDALAPIVSMKFIISTKIHRFIGREKIFNWTFFLLCWNVLIIFKNYLSFRFWST